MFLMTNRALQELEGKAFPKQPHSFADPLSQRTECTSGYHPINLQLSAQAEARECAAMRGDQAVPQVPKGGNMMQALTPKLCQTSPNQGGCAHCSGQRGVLH